jgi:hypothetical protein
VVVVALFVWALAKPKNDAELSIWAPVHNIERDASALSWRTRQRSGGIFLGGESMEVASVFQKADGVVSVVATAIMGPDIAFF